MNHKTRLFFIILVSTLSLPAIAGGSKKPKKEFVHAPMPKYKRIVAIDSVNTNQILASGLDDEKYQILLAEQFSNYLISSGRYVEEPLSSEGAQLELDVAVIAFEAVSDRGVKFGFNPTSTFSPVGVNLDVRVTSMKVTFRISARDTVTSRVVGSVEAAAIMQDKSANISLKYLDFVDLNYASTSKTPLSSVTAVALRHGVAKLAKNILHIPWEAKVTEVLIDEQRVFVKINAGFDVNLKEGDELSLYANFEQGGFVKNDLELRSLSVSQAWAESRDEASKVYLPVVGDRVLVKEDAKAMGSFLKFY